MIKIENMEVMGWEHAIRGMRNPMNSWEKSDTTFKGLCSGDCNSCNYIERCRIIGKNDLSLMVKLCNAGTDHRKFMRMITVYLDITAPLYWWKEFDTYKVGTVANSCSTMHKIAEKEFALEDFSTEHLFGGEPIPSTIMSPLSFMNDQIKVLNIYRELYIETKDKNYWWQIIQLLPSSYNQKRTVMLNYEVLANMYKSRKNHKLDEWVYFCEWFETFPYSELITGKRTEESNNDTSRSD